MAADFLNKYFFVTVGWVGSTTRLITQKLIFQEDQDKESALLRVMKQKGTIGRTVIFVNKKADVESLMRVLRDWKPSALYGDLSQAERERSLAKFKAGTTKLLVATDVAGELEKLCVLPDILC